MNKQFSLRGWLVEFDRRGLTITPPAQVNHCREVKTEAWLQAADAFVPGRLLLADVPLQKSNVRADVRTRASRRRSF